MNLPFLYKYSPKSLNEINNNKDLIKLLQLFIEINKINIILIGDSGSGKSTLIKCIINDYYNSNNEKKISLKEIENNILIINSLKEQGISFYRNEVKTFYYKKQRHPMNTLNKEFAKRYFYRNKTRIKKNKIVTKTFDYLVKNIKYIDLLDIDVEGNEYEIIRKINFKKINFKVILVELTHFNKVSVVNAKKIKNLLKKANYKYIKSFGETSVYKNKKFKI